jgi:hypothetical protein
VADGTDPNDATSFKKVPFTVTKFRGAISFKKENADGFSFVGTLPTLSSGFSSLDQKISLNVQGVVLSFTLDGKGKAKTTNAQLALKLKKIRDKATKKTSFATSAVPFMLKLKRSALRNAWSNAGVVDTTTKNASVSLTIDLVFSGRVYTATVGTLYSAKAGSSGKLKQ